MDSDNTVKQMEMPVWLQWFFAAVGILGVGFFVFQETTRPEPVVLPQAGELVKICQDGATGWSDIGWLRTHDGKAQTDKRAAARTRKEARGRGMLVELPGGSRHTVEVVMQKPLETSEGPVYYVGLAGEDGRVFIRHTELAK